MLLQIPSLSVTYPLNMVLFSLSFALCMKKSLDTICNYFLLVGDAQNFSISTGMTESRLAELMLYVLLLTLGCSSCVSIQNLASFDRAMQESNK